MLYETRQWNYIFFSLSLISMLGPRQHTCKIKKKKKQLSDIVKTTHAVEVHRSDFCHCDIFNLQGRLLFIMMVPTCKANVYNRKKNKKQKNITSPETPYKTVEHKQWQ